MKEAKVAWPGYNRMETFTEIICAKFPMLRGAFRFIDGLNLPVQEAADGELENATYNGWLHEHFISSILVFAPDGM